MNAVVANPDILAQIASFQTGRPLDLQPFHQFVLAHYINRGPSPRHTSVCPNFLLRRDPEFLHLQLQAFGAVFVPWYATRTTADIPRLLRTSDALTLVLLHWVIQNHRVDLFHYLHAVLRVHTYVHPTAIAAYRGSLPIIQYLHNTNTGDFQSFTMEWAAQGGHLDVVQFLHANRSEGCTTQAMDLAAWFGHLDVVKFLHFHRMEGCTTMAMDQAATYGHVGVVRFLHDHRTEGCTTYAMNNACSFGHFEIVQFLHFHRTEGCTTSAFNSAACGGYLDIVKFLHAHRTEGCTHRAMEAAAECKRYDVCLYLSENLPHLVNPSNFTVMMAISEGKWRRAEAEKRHVAELKAQADLADALQDEPVAASAPPQLTSGWTHLLSASVQRGVALMQYLVK